MRCAGVALNTSGLSPAEAEQVLEDYRAEWGAPVADPMRPGAAFEALVDACLA